MNELPDQLLQQTDRIRHRVPVQWKRWVTAACLVLAVGLAGSFLLTPEKAFDAVGNAAEDGTLLDKVESESQTSSGWSATVLTVEKDSLTVRLESGREVKVLLTQLEEKTEFMPNQRIRIYLKEGELPADALLKPYKIEIEEA